MSMELFVPDRRRPRSSLIDQWWTYAERAALAPPSRLRPAADQAVDLIAHNDVLKLAWDRQASVGGPAAGPNGQTFGDFTRLAAWGEIDRLRQQLSAGTYRHGTVRPVEVPKRPGASGTRPLSIPDVQDRVVGRAMAMVLEPLLAPRFDGRSFCRSHRGVGHAVAAAKHLAEQEGRWIWITQDIRGAFDHVPLSKLYETVERYLPSDRLLDLLRRSVGDQREQGLYQGAPLSPLLMNLYLHHLIDRPWRQRHPDVPLLRYMDDVLLLCQTTDNVRHLHEDLQQMVATAALRLKFGFGQAVCDVKKSSTDWLGYRFQRGTGGLEIGLAFVGGGREAREWRSHLRERFIELHERPDAPEAARQMIQGIMAWAGPAWPWMDADRTYDVLRKVARDAAFEEIQSLAAIRQLWRDRYRSWQHNCLAPFDRADEATNRGEPDVDLTSDPLVAPF